MVVYKLVQLGPLDLHLLGELLQTLVIDRQLLLQRDVVLGESMHHLRVVMHRHLVVLDPLHLEGVFQPHYLLLLLLDLLLEVHGHLLHPLLLLHLLPTHLFQAEVQVLDLLGQLDILVAPYLDGV